MSVIKKVNASKALCLAYAFRGMRCLGIENPALYFDSEMVVSGSVVWNENRTVATQTVAWAFWFKVPDNGYEMYCACVDLTRTILIDAYTGNRSHRHVFEDLKIFDYEGDCNVLLHTREEIENTKQQIMALVEG